MSPFPWHDENHLRAERPDPVAVAARVLLLIEHLQDAVQERGDNHGWLILGLAVTARSLARSGDLHSLAILLAGLETLVPEDDRARWPLNELVRPASLKTTQ